MSVAGFGWCHAAQAPAAADFVRQVVRQGGHTALTCLAVPAFRRGDALPEQVAARLGVPLLWVPAEAIQAMQGLCQTGSEKVLKETGFAAVAEACALAAAGPGAVLLVPRQTGEGVTCALAEGKDAE
ncbi:cobalamin biosynthesis protein [Acetobacter farinalis]|uniref:Cobalamin biosynthesis protein n=1 Tax=Acetobacter farinalis TaxID=1260984 RepID=A0ABT3Q6X5_9PROT|nr:cobalamin biosynthesis protein [Acetobacter farinalis]MCX2561038.1 cobalamin biosynthesis protein [Acetobacter farinalis]NHO29712.1 cobalamin biosynthesis protein CbiG [Acetobacter farinalis]